MIITRTPNKLGDVIYQAEQKYIWSACIKCGKERWVKSYKLINNRCRECGQKARKIYRPLLPDSYIPQDGEIRKGIEIGRSNSVNFIWTRCIDCGKLRWVVYQQGVPRRLRCKQCGNKERGKKQRGENNYFWQGGKIKDTQGYIHIKLQPHDFFYPMVDSRGYIKEHRLIMAKRLNRCLLPWEVIHHKNGLKDDNHAENLLLLPDSKYHVIDSVTKGYIKRLENRIRELEAGKV